MMHNRNSPIQVPYAARYSGLSGGRLSGECHQLKCDRCNRKSALKASMALPFEMAAFDSGCIRLGSGWPWCSMRPGPLTDNEIAEGRAMSKIDRFTCTGGSDRVAPEPEHHGQGDP
jgi:hypothetical protein